MTTMAATFDDRFTALAAVAYRVAYRLLGDRSDAEEIAQEALARAYVRWRKVSAYDEPWVARVATNLAIDRWRKRKPTIVFEDELGIPTPGPDALALERVGLIEAIARLPRRQREAISLRYLADLSEREAAEAMHTTVGSVKQHTYRALARLRVDLAPLALASEADDA